MLYISTTKSKNQLSSYGLVSRPQSARNYLKYAASTDIHNRCCTGSCAAEDIWNTKKQCHRQFRGALGFCFTYSFLLRKFFWNKCLEHYWFNMVVAQEFQAKYQVSKSAMCVYAKKEDYYIQHMKLKLPVLENVIFIVMDLAVEEVYTYQFIYYF